MNFDIHQIRKDFPILEQTVNGKALIYFDNAATTQKPRQVIDRVSAYYKKENANIHRGVHYLSMKATEAYENSRKYIQLFLNAAKPQEIIFTKGTTESINLVASSFGKKFIHPGDEILISEMEHHSNIVPWQLMAEDRGAIIRVIPINEEGEIEMNAYKNMLNEKVRIVAVTHVSNVLGTINPVKRMIEMAHAHGIPVLVDGAQAIPHMTVDVLDLKCDFYVFSGHKNYGPMGVGVLYGQEHLLEQLPPYQGGGEMVNQVTFERTTYNELPFKFEAGTPNVVGVLGMETAIRYIDDLDIKKISQYESELLDYASVEMLNIEGLRIIGTADNKTAVISFLLKDIHPYDAGTILDKLGVAVRTGHHCAQPVMDRFKVPGTIRASFALYNTSEEIDHFISAVKQVKKMLG